MKITSTPAAAPAPSAPIPAGATTVAAPSPRPLSAGSAMGEAAGLLANAGVSVPSSSGLDLSTDRYDAHATNNDRASNDNQPEQTRSNDANPFRDLRREEADEPRLAASVDAGTLVEAQPEQLEVFTTVLSALAAKDGDLPAGTLEGFMLTTHDALEGQALSQQMRAAVTAAAQDVHISNSLFERMASLRSLSSANVDVMSLVQSVLRESYMLSTNVMADMVRQLRKTNQLRDKLRDEASKARETKTAWAEQADGDEKWQSGTPYAAMRADTDLNELVPDTYTSEEFDQHVAALQSRSSQDSKSAEQLDASLEQLNGDSRLTAHDRMTLDAIRRGNDDTVKESMAKIKAALPSMNGADLKNYLEKFLDKLNKGNTDEKEIKDLFGAMSPAQMLTVVGDGYTADRFGFGDKDANEFRELTLGKVLELAGAQGQDSGRSVDELYTQLASGAVDGVFPSGAGFAAILGVNMVAGPASAAVFGAIKGFFGSDHSEAHKNQLNEGAAKAILAAAATHSASATAATPSNIASDGSYVGSQRTITSCAGMDDYIKGLEEKMNSIGDDSQLQNVDLQDQLQKAQATMQMMTNLLKSTHDVSMSLARNINS